jgi:LacI family transcriptional regulator
MDVLNPARFGVLTACQTGEELATLPIAFNQGDVDGLIVLGTLDVYRGIIAALRLHAGFHQRPIVALTMPSAGCSAVLLDDAAGGYAVGAHLLNQGHRHLLVPDGAHYEARQRRLGLERAYTEHGLDPAQYLTEFPWHDDAVSVSEERMQAILSHHRTVTAIIAANDGNACQIACYLWRSGSRIPDDYSLTGFDDCEALHNARGENILTTVHAPLREAGQAAAQLLLERVQEHARPEETRTLPVSLIERASTAPPRPV